MPDPARDGAGRRRGAEAGSTSSARSTGAALAAGEFRGAEVELDDVTIRFGNFVAAKNVNITIPGGEFFTILGPSGCGKTTLLRAVSGFLDPSEGNVRIGGADMAGIGPNRRPTALIFQNLALFPLMTVWENIAFSLEVQGVDRTKRRARAEELLELIALPDQGEKTVNELSGGQRQRVAIARALAAEPQVLLLDEPLSALDLKLRQHMRTELRAIQQQVGVTFIYITHDQGEALTMSDNVAVMREGVIEQIADGATLYDSPATPFVASFVGENNLFRGKVQAVNGDVATVDTPAGQLRAQMGQPLAVGDSAFIFVRPESIEFANGTDDSERNRFRAHIRHQEFEGHFWHLFLLLEPEGGSGTLKMAYVNDGQQREHTEGEEVELSFPIRLATALPEGPLAAE